MTMNDRVFSLDPLHFPLTGSHLIEASAGTGKTFTIAMLYVRLVLGHGNDNAFSEGRPLVPPEILVVTFTEAATKELRDRIRARLAEAARYFRPESENPSHLNDPLMCALREDYQEAEWPICARKLELAAEWMDEAAVSTIHGWCNRMLREHAFDSQSPFSLNLETDQTALRSEVVRDYWRIFFYPLGLAEADLIRSYWEKPADLEKDVKNLLDHAERLPDVDEPALYLAAHLQQTANALILLKAPWTAWADDLENQFDAAHATGQIKGRSLIPKNYKRWFDAIRAWANSTEESPDLKSGWESMSQEKVVDAWPGAPINHPGLIALAQLREDLAALPDPYPGLLSHAARWIAKAFEEGQRRRAQIGFNDLLTGLEAALTGQYGDRLAAVIRKQFPVALIDEFQDTDPIQYRIFERIYEIERQRKDCTLILIGDPKQAIYAFRGADIYTYLKARKAVGGHLYTLDRNFRSTEAMVKAVNYCFTQVENRPESGGAFLFQESDDNPVPFLEVHANGLDDAFQVGDAKVPAMPIVVLSKGGTLAKAAYIEQMSEICAAQIVAWLNHPEAGFSGPDVEFRPLQPGDLAILVSNGDEARNIRQALTRRNIRSVYLSDKDTVYATRQAGEVFRWLSACAEPDNDRHLRAALSTPTLGLSIVELDLLNSDEYAWENRVVQFKGYREVWQKYGVLAMLRRILFDFGCNERLLALSSDPYGQSGERILTDLLHLAELLQQASFTLEGEHTLIRFLSEQIANPEGEADGKKLRLESDADLVKVITIHKSKGLQYPIVFLPFISATRLAKSTDIPLKWHDENGDLRISLEADPQILENADRDRLAEDLRKFYVALTRAKYVTWLGLAPVNNCEPSAIGHVFDLSEVDDTEYFQTVEEFCQAHCCFQVITDPLNDTSPYAERAQDSMTGKARRPSRSAKENWWISSYSSLPVVGHSIPDHSLLEDTAEAENLIEGQQEKSLTSLIPRRGGSAMHRFPRGAEAGTFLHDLMEWSANKGFSQVLADPQELRDMIARRCKLRGWDSWVEPLTEWIGQMLTTPFAAGENAIRLDDLKVAKAEMEFWFESSQVKLSELDAIVSGYTLDGRPRPPLSHEMFNGMLKGFMDLVFEFNGRYFVADYKSNWLGSADDDYTLEAMDQAIRIHRYDLQYTIYLFALHRLLKSRISDYDYDEHVGGAVYLFVRGVNSASTGTHFERPPKAMIEMLDVLFSGQARGAA